MKPTLVVFAGRSKCGKTTLAKRLSGEHDMQRATFSDVVRRVAGEKHQGAQQTVKLLQDVGAKLANDDPAGFCRDACRYIDFSRHQCTVLDGLRHKSLLPYLRALHTGLTILVVYVEASEQTRVRRFDPSITVEALHKIDDHFVEREEQSLRAVADLILTTDCSEAETYDQLFSWLKNKKFLARKVKKSDELRIQRLLFRAWIVGSMIWMLSAALYMHSEAGRSWGIVRANERSAEHPLLKGRLLPLECKGLKGAQALDYFRYQDHCWMSVSTFRRLYPEAEKNTDSTLLTESYKSASIGTDEEGLISATLRILRALLFIPFASLCVGAAFYWASKGTFSGLLKEGLLPALRLALWEGKRE